MKLNESVTGYDLAELLHGESGIFGACSPNGEKFQVVTRAGHSISNQRPYGAGAKQSSQPRTWRVRKIGELRREQETVA
jgi:hypothetical protein